jgi:hypothetical protein
MGNESKAKYCEKVCEKFDLPFSDRVRQNFPDTTKSNIAKVKSLILPKLLEKERSKICGYLDRKGTPTQELYG